MKTETKIDPKIMEEIIKFNKNVIEAPKLVPASLLIGSIYRFISLGNRFL